MKKIMFNDRYGLTQAVLEGRKTQTRRIAYTAGRMEGLTIRQDLEGVNKGRACLFEGGILLAKSAYKLGETIVIANLKAENIVLAHRVHQLTDDYNDVARQLRGKEKHEPNTEGYTLGELTEALDKCEALKKDNKMLKQQCVQLQTERDEAQTRADDNKHQKNELFRHIQRFEQSDFMEIGVVCSYQSFAPEDSPVKVGSTKCVTCRYFLKMDKSFCVLCACRYDYMNAGETQGHKNATD